MNVNINIKNKINGESSSAQVLPDASSLTSSSKKTGMQGWLMEKAVSPWGPFFLALVAFCESSFFLIPPDVILIPMLIADRTRAFYLAVVCTLSSVLGGVGGYLLGYYLMDSLGQTIISTYGLETDFLNFQRAFQDYGFWLILLKGVTPIPFKLVAIASGATHMNLILFVVASLIARSFRFLMLALIFWYYGDEAREFYENNFKKFIFMAFIFIVIGFGVLKFFK